MELQGQQILRRPEEFNSMHFNVLTATTATHCKTMWMFLVQYLNYLELFILKIGGLVVAFVPSNIVNALLISIPMSSLKFRLSTAYGRKFISIHRNVLLKFSGFSFDVFSSNSVVPVNHLPDV